LARGDAWGLGLPIYGVCVRTALGGVADMKWLGEFIFMYWLITVMVVVFLAPFVTLMMLLTYLWGMV
jgi:hypothetical protein